MAGVFFTNPVYLWTLTLIPFIILIHIITLRKMQSMSLKFSNFEAIQRVSSGDFLGPSSRNYVKNKNIFILISRLIVYILLILSISGMTLWYVGKASDSDFVLAFDVSLSMLTDDFKPNRLEAAKNAAQIFIDSMPKRTNISIVTFASSVFVERSMDSDNKNLKSTIDSIKFKKNSGTNIGDAIITSSNLLRQSNSKVIILLTDGQSNTGIPVSSAIEYAKSNDVIIYTIGLGTKEGGKFLNTSVDTSLISKLDEDSLMKIAEETKGKYFKAENPEILKQAFKEIASYRDKVITINISWALLIIALIILATEWVLLYTVFRTIP